MVIEVQLTTEPIPEKIASPKSAGAHGSWVEFRGVVRGEENGAAISALEYEAYPEMAEREGRRLVEEISVKHPCLAVKVIHRVGIIPVGDTAIYVGVASAHRAEGIALLAEFMNRLKQDVPIWKRKGLPLNKGNTPTTSGGQGTTRPTMRSLDEAISEIQKRCEPLKAVRVSLEDAVGRVLRETVRATEDLPSADRSTRDGYAILQDDVAESFRVVDAIHAADWKPRQLAKGEAVRIATGGALPGDGLQVVMQEHVQREGDTIRIVKRETGLNIRRRGEDMRVGQVLVKERVRLDGGRLTLLATAGTTRPLVNPWLRVVHFTTGDEIVPPEVTPKPGQVRDSNSILIRGLLRNFAAEVTQVHLSEDFEKAKVECQRYQVELERADMVLISGGASVGDKDFTRPLLEWLGFETVFNQVNVRPGRPVIFGVNEQRVAFGLPGNPLSHFVCFHLFVATALARLVGEERKGFTRGVLAAKLDEEANPRETLWPARLDAAGLYPLPWASSGDVTCLANANTLMRIPAGTGPQEAGAEVDFLTTTL